jgi:hypothetical protein
LGKYVTRKPTAIAYFRVSISPYVSLHLSDPAVIRALLLIRHTHMSRQDL